MPESILVYSYRRCPFAMRVRMTLHEKKIPFEVQEEDLSKFSEKLKQLHPEAKVPVLVHGNHVVYESAVITEYIEDAFPHAPFLMPKDAGARAETRLWTHWCNHLFKPDLDRLKYGISRFSESECLGIEDKVKAHLNKLEACLKVCDWLVGNELSLADIHVFPFYRQLSRVTPTPVFLPQYPSIQKWLERLASRPSFQKTMEK